MLITTEAYLRLISFTNILKSHHETFIFFPSSQDIHRCNGTDGYQKQRFGASTLQIVT